MPCGCASKEVERRKSAWEVFNLRQTAKPLLWHIVVVSAGVAEETALELTKKLGELVKADPDEFAWTMVDTSGDVAPHHTRLIREHFKGDVIHLPDETNVPRAFNVGAARMRSAKHTLLIHDDCRIPDGRDWLDCMAVGLDRGAGMVVPHLTGECANPAQATKEYGAFVHTTEYLSSAAIAFRTQELLADGLNEKLSGYDWWHVDFQVRKARQGRAVLIAPCTLHHEGGVTYNERIPDRAKLQEAFTSNLRAMHESAGWPLDFKQRPRYPRVHLHRPDLGPGKALAAIVGAPDQVAAAWALMQEDGFSQLAVLDSAHDAEIETACDAFDRSRIYYAATYDDDVFRQAVNMPDYQHVRVTDFRVGAALHSVEGRRIRAGMNYVLPGQINEMHLGQLSHYPLGDSLMTTPAIHAFKREFPWVKIIIHQATEVGQIFAHNPDVDKVYTYQLGQYVPPVEMVDINPGNGTEETIYQPFRELGLPEPTEEQLRLRYYLQAEEIEQAVKWLADRGVDVDKDQHLVMAQVHGGWEVKGNWAHFDDLVSKLQASGSAVIIVGNDKARSGDESKDYGGAIRTGSLPIRLLMALIHLMDWVVAFDSGIALAAAALNTSCCSRWGPHDPLKFLAGTGANHVAIRHRSPQMCQVERGTNCRMTHGGSRCPFREGPGADCYDDITADEVITELDSLPKWGRPISSRV